MLEDRHFTRSVALALHGLRVVCYAFIMYAFYGYFANLVFHCDTSLLDGVGDLCVLAGAGWSYTVGIDEYVALTAGNCATLSGASEFFRFDTMRAALDADALWDVRALAWVDVINAGVWLLVVLVLEVDVRLQERGALEGLALRASNVIKVVLYTTLLVAAVYWGIEGDFVDFWDAFLWLVAFVFIELNVFEWRQEERQVLA